MKKHIVTAIILFATLIISSCSGPVFQDYMSDRDALIKAKYEEEHPPTPDTTAPDVNSVIATSHTTIRVLFSEAVDETTATSLTFLTGEPAVSENTYIAQGTGANPNITITGAVLSSSTTIDLTVDPGMIHDADYNLIVKNVADTSDNHITSYTKLFKGRGSVVAELGSLPVDPTRIQSANITVSGTDIISYKLKLTGPGQSGTYGDEIDIAADISLSSLGEGNYLLEVVGKDSLENWQTFAESSNHSWRVDITPPTATITSHPDDKTNSTSAAFSIGGADVVSYKYRVDAGAWSGINGAGSQATESGLTEGSHTFEVMGIDSAGNEQVSNISSFTWEIDLTPSLAQMSNTPDSPTNIKTTDITVGGTDVTHYKYSIDGGAYSGELEIVAHITEAALADGSHTISVIGKDGQGNWQAEGDATSYTWSIDTAAPTVTLTNRPVNPTNQTATDIVVGPADVTHYKYKLDSGSWSGTEIGSSVNISETGLAEGSHTIYVIGRDAVGNWKDVVDATSYTWTVDLSAPAATLSNLPDANTNIQTANINVGGTDVSSYKYKLDSVSWSTETNESTDISLSSLSEGNHTISVIAKDSSNNWQAEANATTYTWTVDITAPTVILSNTPNNPTNDQSMNISVAGDQVVKYKYKLDAGAWSGEIASGTAISGSSLAGGSHTVSVIGCDSAGNWQAEISCTNYTWSIDIVPPTAELSNRPATLTNIRDLDIIVGGSDVTAFKYRIDGGAWSGSEIPIATHITGTNLSEGSHTIDVIARDDVGNWQAEVDTTSYTWTIDISAPTAVISNVPSNPDNNADPSITITGTEVSYFRYSIDDSAWSGQYSVSTAISLTSLSEGSHTLRVRGIDTVGNEQANDGTTCTWTVDLTAPTATISNTPDNPTNGQDLNIAVAGADVTYYMYKIDSGSWSSEIAVGTAIGDTGFAEGSHTVYVVGRDEAGNWQDFAAATDYTWSIDLTAPTVSLNNKPVNPTNQTDLDIAVSGTDVTHYKYKLESGGTWSGEIAVGIAISDSGLSSGSHDIYVIGRDAVGNWQAEGSATEYFWTIDLSAPTALLSNTPLDPINSSNIDIDVSGTDVTAYKYRIKNGAVWGAWSGEISSTLNIVETGISEEAHLIEVIAKDSAENWQAEASATTCSWTVDLTAPTALLSNTPGDPTNDNTTAFTVSGTDVVSYRYNIDGGAWSSEIAVGTSISLTLSEGSRTLSVIGLDNAGNWQSSGAATSFTWEIDQTAPVVPSVTDTGDYDSDITLNFSWTNPVDGAEVKLQIATDSGFTNIVRGGADGVSVGTADVENYSIDVNDGPLYYARIKIRDDADNWSAWGAASDGINVAGDLSGKIKNSSDDELLNATVNLYLTDGHVLKSSVTSDSSGNFSFTDIPIGINSYEIEVDGSTVSPAHNDAVKNNVSVNVGANTDIGSIYLVPVSATNATITGTVVDANDGSAIDGSTVQIKDWTGAVIETITLGASENIFTSVSHSPGTYSVVINKTGYFELSVDNIAVDGNDGNENVHELALCEILTEPHVRVLVQWGDAPKDLDLHVVGPTNKSVTTDGTPNDRFHVYWNSKKSYDENTGNYLSGADPEGTSSTTSLVQDDTNKYGPEAINLFGYNSGYAYGVYTFTVHNWSQSDWYPADTTPVTIRIFDAQGLVQEIGIPSGGGSNWYWKAFKMDVQGTARNQRTITVENTFGTLNYGSKSSMNW